MDEINFLIREDNIAKVYLSEGNMDVHDILNENYGYIVDSMLLEDFKVKSLKCNLFKELVLDNKVVGFCSYDFSREFLTAALNNIYVIPEFRGNKFFLNELKTTMDEYNKPSIMEPTRLIVELLIEYGFARKIDKGIVASAIEFIIPGEHVMSNRDYDASEELATHFYDLNMCASIHFLDLENRYLAYSSPLNYDIIHYDCLEKRKTIDDDYFNEIIDLFSEKEEKLIEAVLDLEDKLSVKTYTLEEVIGREGELSHYMESLIDDAHVTYESALEIKEQIKEEYEAGMILKESLLIRLAYLFEKPAGPSIKSHSDSCPYCEMPVDSHDKFCHFCGINLNYNPGEMFDSLLENIKTESTDFFEDIRYVSYKFLKLVDEGIDLDYAIATIENTYNIDWFNLKEFLDKNNYFNGNITDEGYEFLLNHPLNYYEEFNMSNVNYTDFEKFFYENNSDLNGIEICLKYLNQLGDDEDIREIVEEIEKYR